MISSQSFLFFFFCSPSHLLLPPLYPITFKLTSVCAGRENVIHISPLYVPVASFSKAVKMLLYMAKVTFYKIRLFLDDPGYTCRRQRNRGPPEFDNGLWQWKWGLQFTWEIWWCREMVKVKMGVTVQETLLDSRSCKGQGHGIVSG